MMRGEESIGSIIVLSAGVAVAGLAVMAAVFGLSWLVIR
jgi:hypothetical protein